MVSADSRQYWLFVIRHLKLQPANISRGMLRRCQGNPKSLLKAASHLPKEGKLKTQSSTPLNMKTRSLILLSD